MAKQWDFRRCGEPGLLASVEIRFNCCDHAVWERQSPRFEELGTDDVEGAIVDIEIAHIQPHDFTQAEASASYAGFEAGGVIAQMESRAPPPTG